VQPRDISFDQLVDFRGPDFTQTPLVAEVVESDPTPGALPIKFHDGKEVTAEDVKFSFDSRRPVPPAAEVARRAVRLDRPRRGEDVRSGRIAARESRGCSSSRGRDFRRRAPAFGQKPMSGSARALGQGQRIVLTAFDGYWGGKKKRTDVSGRSAKARPVWPSS
jgi:hypothetical protein